MDKDPVEKEALRQFVVDANRSITLRDMAAECGISYPALRIFVSKGHLALEKREALAKYLAGKGLIPLSVMRESGPAVQPRHIEETQRFRNIIADRLHALAEYLRTPEVSDGDAIYELSAVSKTIQGALDTIVRIQNEPENRVVQVSERDRPRQ